MNWLGENKIPFIRIFSKCDKINSIDTKKKVLEHRKSFLNTGKKSQNTLFHHQKVKLVKI